jgi:hypothetical protein
MEGGEHGPLDFDVTTKELLIYKYWSPHDWIPVEDSREPMMV